MPWARLAQILRISSCEVYLACAMVMSSAAGDVSQNYLLRARHPRPRGAWDTSGQAPGPALN